MPSRGQPPPRFRASSNGVTHEGCVREVNEDNFLANDRLGLWTVADGMGGYSRGDYASAQIVQILQSIRTVWPNPKSLALDIVGRLEEANQDLLNEGRRNAGGTVGSTVACLAVFEDHALAIWCGDSRIYRLRRGMPIERVTKDHTVVQELVDIGELSEDEAESHPHAHVLTRGLGVESQFKPDFRQMTLRHGDRFLLCSDGLTRTVEEPRIAAMTERAPSAALATSALLEAALQAGAPDNVTVVTVDFEQLPAGRGMWGRG